MFKSCYILKLLNLAWREQSNGPLKKSYIRHNHTPSFIAVKIFILCLAELKGYKIGSRRVQTRHSKVTHGKFGA